MKYKTYTIPIPDIYEQINELNAFLINHRIISVEKHFVQTETQLCYVFLVEYYDSKTESSVPKTPKVDYKEILSASDFALFSQLRDYRKQIAESEGKPVYTFFTNEQLAAIVQKKVNSKAALKSIDGIGDAKVEKYGEAILKIMEDFSGETGF
jgi:superfamily II DNA helicase RecQ